MKLHISFFAGCTNDFRARMHKPNSGNIHTSPMVQVSKFVIHHNDSLSTRMYQVRMWTNRHWDLDPGLSGPGINEAATRSRTYSVFAADAAGDVAACVR